MHTFFRMFRIAFQNSIRNFWLSFITITMYLLTLLTINVVLFVHVFAVQVTQQIEEKIEMSVYFLPDTSLEIAQSVRGYIAGFSQVRDAVIITADDAYETFRTQHANDESILSALDEVGENPFGHTLIIRAQNTDDFVFIIGTLQGSQYGAYIDETDADQNTGLIDRIATFTSRIQLAGIILSLFFACATFLMLFNSVRMAIYTHREEIGIMKLVGASDTSIRMPFIIEGCGYVLFACFFLFFGTWIALRMGLTIPAWFHGIDMLSIVREQAFAIIGIELGISLLFAVFATWVALARHLRV